MAGSFLSALGGSKPAAAEAQKEGGRRAAKTAAQPARQTQQARSAGLIDNLLPGTKRSTSRGEPRLWLCLEENAQKATAGLVVAPTKKAALTLFKESGKAQGWGTYEVTEIREVDGYEIVLRPKQ